VHVTAPPDVLLERYRSRDDRHPGHPDAELEQEVAERVERGEWLPLELDGDLLQVDTTKPVEIAELARQVQGLTG
jgi:hypothetical protein